jgi:integrase
MARGAIALISTAWTWGRTDLNWRLPTNPSLELKLPKPPVRLVIYTDSEIRTFIAVADHLGRASIGDSLMLGLFTGQRQGDRLQLEDTGLVDGRRIFRQSKTKVTVAIAETPQLHERLEKAQARVAEIVLKLGLEKEKRPITVVVDETTGRAWNSNTYHHVFVDIRADAVAGIIDEEATAAARAEGRNDPGPIWLIPPCPSLAGKHDQDIRDTAVTWLARAGATLPEIASITGHSLASIHNIMKHYLALSPELGDAGIKKLVAWMEREGIKVA